MKFKKDKYKHSDKSYTCTSDNGKLRPSLSEIVPMMVCAIKPPKTPQNIK